MELKYTFMIPVGTIVLLVLFLLRQKKKNGYAGGTKIWNLSLLEQEPYFKKKVAIYRMLRTLAALSCIVAIAATFILAAQPYKKVTTKKETYNRDILLCLDISYSVDALNLELVDTLKDTVNQMKGERFGIVIFNSSAVLLSPLTDDYNYILETLEQLKASLLYHTSVSKNDYSIDNTLQWDNWLYLNDYIIEGTLVGNEERGSSLIGDGLATSVYDFPDLEEDRTRIVIFSTDNELEGTPLVTLDQAATLCKDKHVIVYGIGTSKMLAKNKMEMEAAMTKTGGKFYLQEESGTVSDIVENIEKEGKSLVKGTKEVQEIPLVKIPALLLFSSVFLMSICMKGLRR